MTPPVSPRARAQAGWQRHASPLARYALLAWALIVIDASLFPFTGWRDLGLAPFDYLSADWPRHGLPFDLFVNALGYAPLGFLFVLALHPRLRGAMAVVVATLSCAVLSAGLEALQTYLPSRVASKVDLASNVAGAVVGALCAGRLARPLLETGRLRIWRARWFASDASRGLVLAGLWFGALVYPDVFAFGTGGLLKILDAGLADRVATALGFLDDRVSGIDAEATARHFQFVEALVAGFALLGVGLLFQNLMRVGVRWHVRSTLLAVFLVASVAIHALAHAFVFEQAPIWPPLTPGARQGIVVAVVVLVSMTVATPRLRWACGLVALLAALLLVNVYPENPYANPVGLAWTRGRLMNFYGLASGVNLIWPWLAVAYLIRHGPFAKARRGPTSRSRQAVRSL